MISPIISDQNLDNIKEKERSQLNSAQKKPPLTIKKTLNIRRTNVLQKDDFFGILKQKSNKKNINQLYNFRIFSLTLKFIKQLKKFSSIQAWNFVKKSHLELIQDNSYISGTNNQPKYYKNQIYLIYQEILSLLLDLPVFSEDNSYIFCFRLIFMFMLIFQVFMLPLKLCWNFEVDILYWGIIPLVLHLIDILVHFNKIYYQDGQEIKNRKHIYQNYMSYKFWFDLINILILTFGIINNIQELTLVYFIRINIIPQIISEIDEKFRLQQKYPAYFTMFKLISMIIYSGHFFGCGFYYVAIQEINSGADNTWIQSNDFQDSSFTVQYVNCIYFAFITMITVGYGDISPKTIPEKIYVILMTIISSGQFAYIINIVNQIFSEVTQKQMLFKEKKQRISNYMIQRGIDSNLQIKVYKYMDYNQNKENERPETVIQILDEVSSKIREKVFENYYGKILKNFSLFNNNFSCDFLIDLSLTMKECLYGPGEIIFNEKDMDEKLYFLMKGEIELYIENENFKITRIAIYENKGSFFGQKSFFTGKQRETGARSITSSNIVYIIKDDFLRIIKKYPIDYEIFCQFRDEINISQINIGEFCQSCNITKHNPLDCPVLHQVMNKRFTLLKINNSQPVENRIKEARKQKRKKYNTINTINIKQMKFSLKKYRKKLINNIKNMAKNNDVIDYTINSDSEYQVSDQSLQSSSYDRESEDDKSFYKNNAGIVFQGNGELIISNNQYSDLSLQKSSLNYKIDQRVNQEIEKVFPDWIRNNPKNIIQPHKLIDLDFNYKDDVKWFSNYINDQQLIQNLENQNLQNITQVQDGKPHLNMSTQLCEKNEIFINKYQTHFEKNSEQSQSLENSQINKNMINEVVHLDQNQFFYFDMDKMKEFIKYYPHFNYSNIIKKYQKRIQFNRRLTIIQKKKDQALENFEKTFFSNQTQSLIKSDGRRRALLDNKKIY